MSNKSDEIIMAVAKIIYSKEISINDFYEAMGCDLDNSRIDASHEVAELAGIIKGWNSDPST